MNWRDYISADPEILTGKPVVTGTELAVDAILRQLAEGWTEEQLFETYPEITPQVLQAVFAFVVDCLSDDEEIMLRKVASDLVLP